MKTEIFQNNLAALRGLNPDQADIIQNLASKVEPRLYANMPLPSGYANVMLLDPNGIPQPIFRRSNPQEEIQAWLKATQVDEKHPLTVVLLGFGLGYAIAELLNCLPQNAALAVIEPDAILFFTAFYYVDLTQILSDARLNLYVGQPIEKAVESIGREFEWARFLALPYELLVLPYLRQVRPNYPKSFAQTWRDALQREAMYRKARTGNSETVVINTLHNIHAVLRAPGVKTLFDQFAEVPAFLVSAGPSAEAELPALKKLRPYVLIACVNTASPLLRRYEIEPHIVFTLDHQERNIRSFQDSPRPEQSFLIADPRVNPQIAQFFYPHVYLASWQTTTEMIGRPAPVEQIPVPRKSGNAVYAWLQSHAGSKGEIFGPGSVAVAAFHVLARMGCRPIVLVGQDLAFTEGRHYAAGTIFDDPALHRDAKAAHAVTAVEGGTVPTSETLQLYRRLLEHEIIRFNIPVFNTSRGAAIKGTIVSRIENIAGQLPSEPFDGFARLYSLWKTYRPEISAPRMQEQLRSAIQHLNRFADASRESLAALPYDDYSKFTHDEKTQMLERLQAAVSQCSQEHQEAMNLLNELLQEAHFEFEEKLWKLLQYNDATRVVEEKINANARVLDAFVKQAHFLIALLEETLERLD